MTEEQKLLLKYSTLLGNYKGFLEGITWWDIPQELKDKIELKIKELEEL